MAVRKVWDHAINLNGDFKASKARVYPLSLEAKRKRYKSLSTSI